MRLISHLVNGTGKIIKRMSSREKILSAIRNSQPEATALPEIEMFKRESSGLLEKYMLVLEAIGGRGYVVSGFEEIERLIKNYYPGAIRIVTTCKELTGVDAIDISLDAHLLENIDLAILKSELGVAENAALWVTEDIMRERVLPFITQYLAMIINKEDIVATMHEAYEKIGHADYGFGTFIAGPSKTADIEQSLVLGAHGPKGMTVFIIDTELKPG
jgi:L-lactate dehydrogenase complex protein LldG